MGSTTRSHGKNLGTVGATAHASRAVTNKYVAQPVAENVPTITLRLLFPLLQARSFQRDAPTRGNLVR